MSQNWNVGDTVTPRTETAWVYSGTEKQSIMSRPRMGVIVDVPLACKSAGNGTVLVDWESLTGEPLKRSKWWTHTSLIERVEVG